MMTATVDVAARLFRKPALLQDESGSALVELALVVGVLGIPLLLGTGQIAPLVYASTELANAAHAGALYGSQSTTLAADSAGMISTTQTEAADLGTMVVVPLMYYACSNAVTGTQYTGSNAQSNAQAACTGANNHALQFVQVSVTLQVTSVIRCPGIPTSFTLNASSVMEVQQS